jgi:cysteinyl-tRNA synthetase
MPRATDNIPQMKQVIEDLLAKGCAYPAGQPGKRAIYFDVQKFKAYGQLSGNTLDQLRGGAGGRVDDANTQEKHHPADFLLWKEDNTHKMKWPSPKVPGQEQWGEGYPGWHIECTAMALRRLIPGGLDAARTENSTIDLHSGGEDNIFPHHECEIAQSCCFTGAEHFANHWFHPRFLKVDGQKMSKSKGTMYTLGDLTKPENVFRKKPFSADAVRLELIKTHYRANADFSEQGLKDSERMIDRWRDYARLLLTADSEGPESEFTTLLHEQLHDITQALSDDLNIASAIGWLNKTIGDSKPAPNPSYWQKHDYLALTNQQREQLELEARKKHVAAAENYPIPESPMETGVAIGIVRDESLSFAERSYAALHLIDNILGVIFRPIEKSQDTGIALYQPGVTPSPEIEALLQQRADAKKAKDFAAADAIRDQLTTMGLAIMDKPAGKVEVAIAN